MAPDGPDPVGLAAQDQERAEIDRLADLVIRLDQRLAEGGLDKRRRRDITDRWLYRWFKDPDDDS